jgi:hypothetical protein
VLSSQGLGPAIHRRPRAVVYRLLCLTRNLTFDRQWDIALSLEGPLLDRKNAIARNRPLGDFVDALPTVALGDVDVRVRERTSRLAAELRRVDFTPPDGFDDLRFWPLGIEGYRRTPFSADGRRLFVMSPFLSKGFIAKLFEGRSRGVLVSTLHALAELESCPDGVEQVFTIADAANPEPEETDAPDEPETGSPFGLHAKCYVIDDGHAARVLTGSANATLSGFSRNVEFLVELGGSRRVAGIESLLA